jgi:acetoin:2,6-dichlorophenolindophenol oxidoreductase subunit alpha
VKNFGNFPQRNHWLGEHVAGRSTGGSLIDDAKLKQLYATMLQCRLLTEHARSVPKQGRRFYSASMGQEAIATGCAIDLRPEDTVVLGANASIAGLVKGMAMKEIVAGLYARSSNAANPEHNIIGPASVDGDPLQVATTVALANQQKNNSNVVVAFTSSAAIAESSGWNQALKMATRRNLPIVFVLENNPWARTSTRNGREHLALRMQRAGLTSITVDGNDVVAVYRVAHESLGRVRQGGGPVLVEGKAYHREGQARHSTERDPLTHMERYLTAKKLFSSRWKDQLVRRYSRELAAAVQQLGI